MKTATIAIVLLAACHRHEPNFFCFDGDKARCERSSEACQSGRAAMFSIGKSVTTCKRQESAYCFDFTGDDVRGLHIEDCSPTLDECKATIAAVGPDTTGCEER